MVSYLSGSYVSKLIFNLNLEQQLGCYKVDGQCQGEREPEDEEDVRRRALPLALLAVSSPARIGGVGAESQKGPVILLVLVGCFRPVEVAHRWLKR